MANDIEIRITMTGGKLSVDKPDGETGTEKTVTWTHDPANMKHWTVGFFGKTTPFKDKDRLFSSAIYDTKAKDSGKIRKKEADLEPINKYWIVGEDTAGRVDFLDPRITLTDIKLVESTGYAFAAALEEIIDPGAANDPAKIMQADVLEFLENLEDQGEASTGS